MIRRPPRSTHCISSAASDVYKRQLINLTLSHKYNMCQYVGQNGVITMMIYHQRYDWSNNFEYLTYQNYAWIANLGFFRVPYQQCHRSSKTFDIYACFHAKIFRDRGSSPDLKHARRTFNPKQPQRYVSCM